MKPYFLIFALLLTCSSVLAQKQLPLLKASSKKATIIEGAEIRLNWYLNPKVKPDTHIITKHTSSQSVSFYTDIDSIKIKLKPGKHFDFIVVLNGKDSCYTRIQSLPLKNDAHLKPEIHDTIPFVLTAYNNLKIKAILNKTDTLDLKFDSGTTGLLLTNDAIKNKIHKQQNNSGNHLQIGKQSWDNLTIYPVELSGQGTDGRFGWDLFDGKIVEIDYDKNLFIIHSKRPEINKHYSRFDIEYTNTIFCIQAALEIKGKKYPNRFLFDNGYQRTIMLDTIVMHEQHYPKDLEIIKKVIMKNGQGEDIPILTVNNEKFLLGKYKLTNIPVQLMTGENPAQFKTHILGNEVLKRFNTILDFQKNYVYLKPNTLIDLPYHDAK